MRKKGVAFILALIAIVVLTILGAALFTRSVSESRIAERFVKSAQAFWLAEAGVNRALDELRADYNISGSCLFDTEIGQGRYCVDIVPSGNQRIVNSYGFVALAGSNIVRELIAVVRKVIPPDFYGYAIYSAETIDLRGEAYTIDGSVIYGDSINPETPGNISGDIIHDSSIKPLARLDFEQLKQISLAQGNHYVSAPGNKVVNSQTGQEAFPQTFWYEEPSDPEDPATGIPNVVYVECDLRLNGRVDVGGFYVVAGDVITDPDDTGDLTINGYGEIDGLIYTRGNFRVNGGGTGLNVYGGVWSGQEARLNGNVTIEYNEDYMRAVEAMNINPEAQISFWKDLDKVHSFPD